MSDIENIEIGPISKNDLAEVVALEAKCFPNGECYNHLIVRQIFDAVPSYFLVARKEKIIGHIAALVGEGGQSAWIVTFGIDPDFRGAGISKLLGGALLKRLEEDGVQEIFLTVRVDNFIVRTIAERAGFVQTGEEENYFGAGEKRLIYVKRRGASNDNGLRVLPKPSSKKVAAGS